jgi:hypothetical protein
MLEGPSKLLHCCLRQTIPAANPKVHKQETASTAGCEQVVHKPLLHGATHLKSMRCKACQAIATTSSRRLEQQHQRRQHASIQHSTPGMTARQHTALNTSDDSTPAYSTQHQGRQHASIQHASIQRPMLPNRDESTTRLPWTHCDTRRLVLAPAVGGFMWAPSGRP